MPMSFHRTEINRVYAKDSDSSKVVAGFAIEHARHALGAACVRMLSLFPDITKKIEPCMINELKAEYGS
jgi:hypothetical protein